MAIQTSTKAARALNLKPSPVVYKKTTLKSDYMKCPANAIVVGTVGPNKGKLLLACGILNMIIVLDPDTGKVIREYGQEYDTQGGLDDVREGPDGTLYFTHLGADFLGYIRPDGTHGKIPVKPSSNSIVITRDGKWLYYGLCILDDELWRVELEDGLPKKGAKHELVEQNPGWANSMIEGADGYIYSPINMYGEIRRINPETKEITVIATNVEFPSSCKVNDATGVVYVSEFHLGYISRIDPRIKDPRKNKRVLSVTAPTTDNVGVMSGPQPRLFGTTFCDDWIYEVYETGDPLRTITKGGLLPSQIHVMKGANGDRIFVRDVGRVREYFPIGDRYSTIAHGCFWQYAQDKAFDKGFKRYDPERINWTASFEDRLTIPYGKVLQPTSEGNLLVGGGMFEDRGNRLAVIDIDSGEALRTVKNLDHVQDAIMVGKDIYMMEGTEKEYPIAARITRITPDDKRETVFTGKDFVAFARSDDAAFAADVGANTIYQVVKDGKWLAKPIELVSGLNGPQGMTIGHDGNLLVMENNDGHNGRMLKVDLKTKEITVLADALGVDRKLDKRNWNVVPQHAVVAQTSDGTIYFTEPGVTSFSVLRAQ
jgi:sugar lactone lactonase YvrE